MNIQGIGQSFSAYPSTNMRGSQGASGGFELPSADSIMESDDANLDGVLSIEETPMDEKMFADADSDSDGLLSSQELEDMLSNGPPPMMGGGMGGMGPGMMGGEESGIQSILETEDTDADGSISSEETSLSSEIFSALDTNQDGVISQDELAAAQVGRQEETSSMQEGMSSKQTTGQNQAINAYRQVMESFMGNLTGSGYDDANLSSFIQTMA
jgi:Ca2+-binding EF-hand superfamily protein